MRWRAERTGVSFACLLLVGSAWAQPNGFPAVSPAQQAQRDAARLQLLRTELAAEEQGLARAGERRAERAAVNDAQGMAEAEQALEAHRRNVQALRAEIERAGQRVGLRTVAIKQRQRQGAAAVVSRPVGPWWDAYGNPPLAQPGPAGTGSNDAPPSRSGSAWWSAYSGGSRP